MISRAIDNHVRQMAVNENIVDLYNNKYGTELLTTEISLVKVMVSENLKKAVIYYSINNKCPKAKQFFIIHKAGFIRKLKKKIKIFKFPNVTFKYDKSYELIIGHYITNLLNT